MFRVQAPVVVLLTLLVGCGSSGSGVDLTLRFDSSVSDATLATVRSFAIDATGDETYQTSFSITRGAMREERLVYHPGPATRDLHLAVLASDGQAMRLAYGEGDASITPGHATDVTIVLSAHDLDAGVPDGGAEDGGDGGSDMTITGRVTVYAGISGGAGSADGVGTSIYFDTPTGVAVDGHNFYVVDSGASTFVAIDRTTGVGTRLVGSPYRVGSDLAHLSSPSSAVVMGTDVYVTDKNNNAVRKWDGTQLTELANPSHTAGSCSSGELSGPVGITSDGTSTLYVVASNTQSICSVSTTTGLVSLVAGNGTYSFANGAGTSAEFMGPYGVAYTSGALYVGDRNNFLLRAIALPSNVVSTLVGTVGTCDETNGPPLSAATTCYPASMGFFGGTMYFTDDFDIRSLVPTGTTVSPVAGVKGNAGYSDGKGLAAHFQEPRDVVGYTSPTDGPSLLVADSGNHAVRSVRLSDNTVTTIAGSAGLPGTANGVRTSATFASPSAVAIGGSTVYVADTGNAAIRTINVDAVGTLSHTGTFHAPSALAVVGQTVYVADSAANEVFQITIGSGETTALIGPSGMLAKPQGIAADASAIYVADTDNNLVKVFGTNGTLVKSLDLGLADTANVGCNAGLGLVAPVGLALDATSTHLYIAASGNCMVFDYDIAAGTTKALAGGVRGSANGIGTAARFDAPLGLALDGAGSLYVADSANASVRRIELSTASVTTYAGVVDQIGIVPGVRTSAHLNRGRGLAWLPNVGLLATMPSENSIVLVTP